MPQSTNFDSSRFELGLKPIQLSDSNDYLKQALIPPKKEEVITNYNPKKIPLGFLSDNKILYNEIEDAEIFLLFGKRGSGKTFLLRSMIDRYHRAGYSQTILTDIKDEFKSSALRPVQYKFRRNLFKGEQPSTTPIKTIRPTFYRSLRETNELPSYNIWGSCSINLLNRQDFLELLGYNNFTPNQKILLQQICDKLDELDSIESIDIIYEILEQIEEIKSIKNIIKRNLYLIKKSDFFMPEYLINPVKLIQDGYIPCLNLEGYEYFGSVHSSDSTANYPRAIVGIWLNMIYLARKQGKIKPLWFILDEASRFCKSGVDSNVRSVIEEIVDVARRYNVSLTMVYQEYNDVPAKIINQAKYLFFPRNIAVDTLQEAMRKCGLLDVSSQQRTYLNSLLKKAKKLSKHSWLRIDKDFGMVDIFIPASPLSAHSETIM